MKEDSQSMGEEDDLSGKIRRIDKPFVVKAPYKPSGDQPQAIQQVVDRIKNGENDVVLMGATGTGKTATAAWVIEKLQRPTLIIEPNKTLAAQLCSEFRQLMPDNAVNYFVSYYDYYQPEAYIPQTDTYIEKDSNIDDNVERLRHATTASLLTRRDCVVVSTVSCLYGLGTPQEYAKQMVFLSQGQQVDEDKLLRKFVSMQYKRNDIAFTRGTFRVRGDTVEIIPVYEENAIRLEFFGDEIDRISMLNPVTGDVIKEVHDVQIFPATQYANGPDRIKHAVKTIQEELDQQVAKFKKEGKLLEAERLQQRTTYDLEMISQIGTCSGIENYSRHFDQRPAGSPPNTLLDFFPDDFLTIIDESHVTVPQIGAMYNGDMSRKRTLVQYGFRLPSAMDNRPLKWDEFEDRVGQTLYMSATPGDYELSRSDGVVEQVIRPTGLLDPKVEVRPVKGQVDDLLDEINARVKRNERVLVTTLTKKMAEDLTDYLLDHGIKVTYLHSDVDTLKRVEILRELREGKIDVVVGINLLREGLDLPEVSLVAILDADKEGFLRSYRSLIQTIGRAARNVRGTVIMYADSQTDAMKKAIDETERRRAKQIAFNKAHGITPKPIIKKISDVNDMLAEEDVDTQKLLAGGYRQHGSAANSHFGVPSVDAVEIGERHEEILKAGLPAEDLVKLIKSLDAKMHQAADELQFELAGRLRDEIRDLKKELRQMVKDKS
jgi:excinuclease ABC subunit B